MITTFSASEPEAPVMVTLALPVLAPEALVRVSVDEPVPGTARLCELKLALMPVGRPEADRATLPLKPPSAVLVILTLPFAVELAVTLAGIALKENPGTLRVIACL